MNNTEKVEVFKSLNGDYFITVKATAFGYNITWVDGTITNLYCEQSVNDNFCDAMVIVNETIFSDEKSTQTNTVVEESLDEAIYRIDEEMCDKYGTRKDFNIPYCELTTANYLTSVEFVIPANDAVNGIMNNVRFMIYHSEYDTRKFDEDNNTYEKWYDYLKRQIKNQMACINTIEI